MNILYSQLSTLFSLWNSLDVDACTINKKLDNVLLELEKLIKNERTEKRLLSADIEDMMANIEYASNLLGVSLENLLNSGIITAENINFTSDALSIYNDINPTYPKQKALIELNSRLTKEISTRSTHLTEWLSSIQSLCKELSIPYKFKSLEEYIENDLSWATIQSISCELRDLQSIQICRMNEFELLCKTIHYYSHMTGYEGSNDSIELSLSKLFENFPLDVNITSTNISTPSSYYHHPTNELKLTQTTLKELYSKSQQLKSVFDSRYHIYFKSTEKIKAIWEEFNVPILERPTLPVFLTEDDMLTLKNIVYSIEPLVRNAFDQYIQSFKDPLMPLWDACLLSQLERNEFMSSLYELNTKIDIKSKVDHHMTYLHSIQVEGKALRALMKERKELIQKMIDFEKTASDPKRLFQASFRLLEEEKWRNTCLPHLLQLDRQLIKAIGEFEKMAGKPVMIGDRRYLDTLLDEIADREANQTFFGFLNSEPALDRPISKRIKNRPASVGSLGSLATNNNNNKKPSLKTRAVSAIISPSSQTNNSIPKKIKPSQSMPLSKLQKQKKSLSRKNSNIPAFNNKQNSNDDDDDDDDEQEDLSLYSNTAYINSNITLTKAFNKRPNQMSSMIPIASRTPLTTTKSI